MDSNGSPARQGSRLLCSEEEERDVAVLDDGGTDAVCQTGQFLQAVGMEPPVPGHVDVLLHVEDGQAELLAVAASRAKLKHSEPR